MASIAPLCPPSTRVLFDRKSVAPVLQAATLTLREIDRIHRVPLIQPVPLAETRHRKCAGCYEVTTDRFRRTPDRPERICVSRYGDHLHLTVAHELGHYFDNQVFAPRCFGYGSEHRPAGREFEALQQAWAASDAIRNLVALQSRNLPHSRWVDLQRLREYLLVYEIWARTYAQWIAARSCNLVLLTELNQEREIIRRETPIRYNVLWEDADFGPIGKAMDRLFSAWDLMI